MQYKKRFLNVYGNETYSVYGKLTIKNEINTEERYLVNGNPILHI
jgi:hypothetical protein